MQVIADGRHSVPTAMTIASGGVVRQLTIPPLADSTVPGAVTTVPLTFPALTGSHFVVTFTGVRDEYAANYYSAGPLALPLGIAEIGIPGATAAPTPAQLPGTCVPNLLTIDGRPVDVSIVGSTARALDGGQSQLVPCGPDANGLILAAGTHVVQTAVGHNPMCSGVPADCTGWNVDQLVLDSAAGGGAGPAVSPTAAGTPQLPATQPGPAPAVTVTASHIDTIGATVHGATAPFAFVLGQSVNKGWQAIAAPGPGAPAGSRSVDLGTSELIDGFANGWRVSGADLARLGGPTFTVTLTWTPQREVWAALAVSAATLALCLVLAFLPLRWRRWLRARLPRRLRGPAGPDGPERPTVPFDSPALALPFARDPSAHRRGGWVTAVLRAVAIGVVTGAVASLVVPVAAAVVVAAGVAGGLLLRWVRIAVVLGALAFLVAGCVEVVGGQRMHHYLPGSNWAGEFVHAGNLIWLGVVLLLADAAITAFGYRFAKPLRRRAMGAQPSPATGN
jgi:arabinofuranan 3-O-arabinosyltransferase